MSLADLIDTGLGLWDRLACQAQETTVALWCGAVALGERLIAFYTALLGPWLTLS